MWNRKEVKAKGRQRFKANYWKSVLVVLILVLLEGGTISYNFGDHDVRKLFTGGNFGVMEEMKDNLSEASDDLKDASRDLKEAQQDIKEAQQEVQDALNSNFPMVTINLDEYFDEGGKLTEKGSEMLDEFSKDVVEFLPEIIAAVCVIIFIGLLITAIGICVKIFVFNPLTIGGMKFLVVNPEAEANFGLLGSSFKGNHYKNIVKVSFLRDLFTFLWSLLFFIPGVIKYYEYRMIPYLLAEHPEMSADEAFATSKKMMDGNKWSAFVLDLSFIGWHILDLLTFGILGVFYVNPYHYQSNAELYAVLKKGGTQTTEEYENYVEVE